MQQREALKIVVYKEEDKFVAQAVDFDICTQADDIETLTSRMDCLIVVELKAMDESGLQVDPAPKKFHNMWEQNQRLTDSANEYKVVAA